MKVSKRGILYTTAYPEADAEMILQYKKTVLKAARKIDSGVCDISANGEWQEFRIGRVPIEGHLGKEGMDVLARQIVVENARMELEIMKIGWIATPRTLQANQEAAAKTAIVVMAVRDKRMATEILKVGLRIGGNRAEVTPFVRTISDAQCLRCCGWGHITALCTTTRQEKCMWCAGNHLTVHHQCDVAGCKASRGRKCDHLIEKCANCGGSHPAGSRRCTAKPTNNNTEKQEANTATYAQC